MLFSDMTEVLLNSEFAVPPHPLSIIARPLLRQCGYVLVQAVPAERRELGRLGRMIDGLKDPLGTQ